MGKNTTKVTVLLDCAEFERFHRYCSLRGFKKSTLIARLIREHLNSESFETQGVLPFKVSREGES